MNSTNLEQIPDLNIISQRALTQLSPRSLMVVKRMSNANLHVKYMLLETLAQQNPQLNPLELKAIAAASGFSTEVIIHNEFIESYYEM